MVEGEPLDNRNAPTECIKRSMKTVFLVAVLGSMVFSVEIFANILEVKKAVEEAHCKKLATAYAKDPQSSTVQSIAQLQICLAQTLKATASPVKPRNLTIQPPSSSTNTVDTTLPKQPTPPTPPSTIKIR